MRTLLVIKPSSLGDIVHGLQVMQTVARAKPELRISWVVRERFAELVRAAPFVEETIIFRRRDGWMGFLRLLRELRGRRFDAVWDMQALLRSGVMSWAVHAKERWGRPETREGAGLFYTKRVGRPPHAPPHHAVEILLEFARAAGVEPKLAWPLALAKGDTFSWDGFFTGDPANTFVIFTDSRGKQKEWRGFPELMKAIWETVPGSRIAWCAGKHAEPPSTAPEGRLLNLTGCPLDEMIALVRKPAVFVGNDSGPMHLSAASGNRVLAIFGPTDPRRFGPFPLDRARHRVAAAPGGKLDQLTPAAVLETLNALRREP